MAISDSPNLNQLRQLRAFCYAAQTGSISKAAERLKLSQPSVSLQIQALEKELDTLLFERCGPKIRLTPAGDLLLEMAQPLVDGIDVPDDMVYHPIYDYTPSLIMCKGHPLENKESVTLEDISPYGLILPPRHLSTWSLVDLVFQQHGVPYNVVLEAGGWEVIKRYVEIGTGISIVTSICLRGFENLSVRPMGQYFPNRSYGVVVRRGKFLSPQAKQFLQLMDGNFFARQTTPPPRKRKASNRSDALITNL